MIDLKNAALIVIDMQHFFISSEHTFNRTDFFNQNITEIVENCNKLITYCEIKNLPIIFTRQLVDTESLFYKNNEERLQHLLDPLLSKIALDYKKHITIEKKFHDAFYKTELELLLKEKKIESLLFCGIYTNICVETTMRSALNRNFHPIIVKDATLSYSESAMHETFFLVENLLGSVINLNSLSEGINEI